MGQMLDMKNFDKFRERLNSEGSNLSGISGVKSHLHSDSSVDNEYWVNLKVEET